MTENWMDDLTAETVLDSESFTKCYYNGKEPENPFTRQQNINTLRDKAKSLGVSMKNFDCARSAFDKCYRDAKKQVQEKTGVVTDPIITVERVEDALYELGISVRYDILMKEVSITGMPEECSKENAVNTLPVLVSDRLRAKGVKGVSRVAVDDYIGFIADKNKFNPLKELFSFTHWDNRDRWPEVFQMLGGIEDPYYMSYIRKWFIQCVAIGLNDEGRPIGAEGVLVLQGKQGIAKTSFFRNLVPYPKWFTEGVTIDMRDKDSQIKALGGWITELGELDSTLKRDQTSLKAFVTSPRDKIRMPYARAAVDRARRTSFCGTVNQVDYLRDETGSRRFWTVPIDTIDKKKLFSLSCDWVFQLWAQVYEMYKQDENGFRLTENEKAHLQAENERFSFPLAYEPEIREMLDFSLPVESWEWWKASEVAQIIGKYASAYSVGKVLAKILGEFERAEMVKSVLKHTQSRTFVKSLHGYKMFFLPLKRSIGVSGAAKVRTY